MRDFWIVYVAETKRRLRSRAFQIGLVIGMLGVAGMIQLPGFLNSRAAADQRDIMLAGAPSLVEAARPLLEPAYRVVATQTSTGAPTESDLGKAHAGSAIALVATPGGLGVTVYSLHPQNLSTDRIAALLVPLNAELSEHLSAEAAARIVNVPVDVRIVGKTFASPQAATAASVAGLGLLVVLYLIVILNSQLTLTSVIEEKTNRIAELLVAAIDPLPLLYAKIFSGTTLAIVQMIAWLIVGALSTGHAQGQAVGGSPSVMGMAGFKGSGFAGLNAAVLPAFVFFMFVGLLQFSTMYAAIGSLVSRPEDLGSISSALIFPIVAAFFTAMLALEAPSTSFVVVASFLPFIAPFVMFVRIVMSDPPLWQIALCAAINVAALWIVAVAAGRLYRVGMLLYGRPPSFAQIWKTVRSG